MTKIETVTQAAGMATELAQINRYSEGEAIAAAEVWFDAGKDFNRCDQDSLAAHLATHFGGR